MLCWRQLQLPVEGGVSGFGHRVSGFSVEFRASGLGCFGFRLGLGLRALCKSWVLMRVRVFVAACAHAIECASDMLCCVTLCFDGRHVPVAGARGHKRVRKQETARETPAHDVLIPCFWFLANVHASKERGRLLKGSESAERDMQRLQEQARPCRC